LHKDTESYILENPLFIHILTDFDAQAPETTIYKAILNIKFPGSTIIFSHQPFKKGDVIAPAVFLRMVTSSFPADCVHICLLHIGSRLQEKYAVAKYKNQYFFIPDNGLLSIAFPGEQIEYFKTTAASIVTDVFQQLYIPALEFIIQNPERELPVEEKPKVSMLPQPSLIGNTYRLSVLFNDSQGNAYLNMQKEEFTRLTAGKRFTIKVAMKETIEVISNTYTDATEGSKLAMFGLGDMLQIAINCGSAAQYLGLGLGQMVMLEIH
jgi:S-adenosyl-L-methionine hydrolase (adenosine-forming)